MAEPEQTMLLGFHATPDGRVRIVVEAGDGTRRWADVPVAMAAQVRNNLIAAMSAAEQRLVVVHAAEREQAARAEADRLLDAACRVRR